MMNSGRMTPERTMQIFYHRVEGVTSWCDPLIVVRVCLEHMFLYSNSDSVGVRD